MKNVLTSFALFLVCVLNAQQVIVDEKFDKDYGPIGYHFSPLSNKIFIEKGKHLSLIHI